MMRSLSVVKEQIVGQSFMEEGFVVDNVKVVIDELFLESAVVAFDEAVNFRAVGIGEEVRDFVSFELGVKIA